MEAVPLQQPRTMRSPIHSLERPKSGPRAGAATASRPNPPVFVHATIGLMVFLASVGSSLLAQAEFQEPAQEAAQAKSSRSAAEAFEAGDFDQAATRFADRVERRPNDPGLLLNLGSALHQLKDYEGARSAFEKALTSENARLKAKATYDLGNTAYRQGRLQEAADRYVEALDFDPDDEDAKHNLEFVRQELQRRQDQAKQRQQNQQGQEQQEQNQDGEQGEQGEEGEEDQAQQNQDQSGDQQQQNRGEGQGQQEPEPDSDGDGLGDQDERSAENPTDPRNPDTDGDGLSDGEEDKNRNGKVDPGETDPNKADGQNEGGAPESQQEQDSNEQNSESQQGTPVSLSPEEAQRLLAALDDRRPTGARDGKTAKKSKKAKDW